MTYPINIIINNRIWYDSRIVDSDPVVFQNVNYATGDRRSVNIVRQRFMQDWARRTIPNSIRQGIGLIDPAGSGDEIVVTQGYAVVGGRFLDIPADTYNADTEGLTGSGGSPVDHYFMIRVTPELEGDNRDPTLESAALVARPVSTYLSSEKSHNDLILAKFRYNGSVIDQFEDYTSEQEWQANVISPPATRPGLTTATTENILLRAGAFERVNVMNIETDKARFYLNAVFDDQDASTEVKLINKEGILLTRDITDLAYLGQDMLDLKIGGGSYIDSSGNQTNVGTINSHTIQGGTDTFVMLATADTLSNKTLTTDTVITQINTDTIAGDDILIFPSLASTTDYLVSRTSTDTLTNKILTTARLNTPQFNEAINMTATSTELNQLDGVEVGGTATGDIVDLDTAQTLENKTLETLVIEDEDQSNTITFGVPDNTGNKTMTIPSTLSNTASENTFIYTDVTQILTNKTLETLVIQDSNQSNIITFGVPNNTDDKIMTIPSTLSNTPSENTFVYTDIEQTLTNKTLDGTNALNDFTLSTHTHTSSASTGGEFPISNTTGTLAVGRGGTGNTTFNGANRLMYATSSTGMTTLSNPGAGRFLASQTGAPSWQPLDVSLYYSGGLTGTADSGTFTNSGDLSITLNPTIVNNSHTHTIENVGTQTWVYTPKSLLNGISGSGIATPYGGDRGYVTCRSGTSEGSTVFFGIPRINSKAIDSVGFRIKNIEGFTREFTLYTRGFTDTSGGSSAIAGTLNPINDGVSEDCLQNTNFTFTNKAEKLTAFIVTNSSVTDYIVTSIWVTYTG